MHAVLYFMQIKLTEWEIQLRQREGGKERLVNVVRLV